MGDVEQEFAHLGLTYPPVPDRQAALDEALSIMPKLLRGEEVTLHGAHIQIEGARIRPEAPQRPHVPILVAEAERR